jgi:pyruvate dehydrogenase E2 component (dihydrolipoamide acetyltransferase)
MATKVHMEALSPTMEEGQLVRWVATEGESVSSGQVLAEIETDKATMELVARGEGVLRKILLQEGGTAPVGEVIAVIGSPDEDIGDLVPEDAGAGGPEAPSEPAPASDEPRPPEGEPPAPVTEAESAGTPASAPAAEGGPPETGGTAEPEAPLGDGRVKASPLARRMAREGNLDLGVIRGSGPGGRIVKRDVEAAQAEGLRAPSRPVQPPDRGALDPGVDFEDVPLSQMRKTIAKRLVGSLSPIPHFFLRITVDMTRTLAARRRVNQLLEDQGDKISINDFILKATAGALARHPEVNAEWTDQAIRRHYRVHLGVAVAVEDGLITPVIRDADRKGLAQISREIRELASRGREKRLQPEEYTGSTFSVSNLGMFGIHEFTGVINPPESGILAVGGVEDTPVVEEGQVVVRPLMKVTMSCDHRVIDGATGARFLQTLKEMLEEPAAILV